MILLKTDCLDPYFNLASEEYLIDHAEDDLCMLWRNDKSVIIGNNQNAYAELNLPFVEANKVKVVRRLTGGGAVFHDPGNVNFTFIVKANEEERQKIDFARFTRPIIDFLHLHGANASLSGRNDILIDGKKISGNAQCVRNGRIMHHGTLLFSSDMNDIAESLRVDEEKIRSKGIKSVRNRVANISESIADDWDTVTFLGELENYICSSFGTEIRTFTEEEKKAIALLSETKYSTWAWNYGESKSFSSVKKARFPFGSVSVSLNAEHGVISDISFTGDFFSVDPISLLEKEMIGKKLEQTEILLSLEKIGRYIAGAMPEDILPLIL